MISAFSHCITSQEITPNPEKSAVLSALFGTKCCTVGAFWTSSADSTAFFNVLASKKINTVGTYAPEYNYM